MSETPTGAPDAVVFGATGFIGRWTVLHLLGQGRAVAAAVRRPGRGGENIGRAGAEPGASPEDRFRRWLHDHGAVTDRLTIVTGDLTTGAGLGLSAADDEQLADVRDVFNAAAVYRFGMSRAEARAVNVDGAVNVLRWAATRPGLRRLVHVSGYRVGLDPQPRHPVPEATLVTLYRDRGAYEGSKIEGDAAVRVLAAQWGVPLTVVNPSSVIGHSTTGEAGQYIGLAALVRDLWAGRLPVLPGTARTFVPVVTVDHFTAFMAAIPEHDPEPGGLHWVLDENTPELPELVLLLADHLGVPAPRMRVPAALVRRLPAALTGADPEALPFLTEDRYDTASAGRTAADAGLQQPSVENALRRWADRLVADRFGAARAVLPGGFHAVAGSRTYLAGDRAAPDFVLLHGLPLDGESWQGVLQELDDASALVADLPGLGRSAPAAATPLAWLSDLLAPTRTRPVVVAHSAAAAPALRYAAAHPDRLSALLLVSPYFLQAEVSRSLRTPALAAPLMKRLSADRLTTTLLGPSGNVADAARHAAESAVAQLHRPGVARRTASWLRASNRPAERAGLRALLAATAPASIPVHIVVGRHDPLTSEAGAAAVTTIPDAGHHPQLSHPAALAAIMRRLADGVTAGPADRQMHR